MRHGCRGQRIADVVSTWQGQFDSCFAYRGGDDEAAVLLAQFDSFGGEVGVGLQREMHNFNAATHSFTAEPGRKRIVGIDHRDTTGTQGAVDRPLGFGASQQTAHPLQVGRATIVDQGHLRHGVRS